MLTLKLVFSGVGYFGDQKSRMVDKCTEYITMTLNATFSIKISSFIITKIYDIKSKTIFFFHFHLLEAFLEV